ncbi:MAG: LPS-assembly protein LptD [Bacteroidaceae bacterium]|nr:LPS-assembly protein LptD [Bacteroidaceae bacterium]
MNISSIRYKMLFFALSALVLFAMPSRADIRIGSTLWQLSAVLDTISVDTLAGDSVLLQASDSIPEKKEKKDAIEDPVFYESSDSMVWSSSGNAYLYGDSKVKYQNIQLDAEIITMNMDSSVVSAMGKVDSLGVASGLPVFKDGDTPYESDKISYNFKSKRGIVNNVFTSQGDGFMTGERAKKDSTGAFYARRGAYTTCDAEHPHFYIALTRAKVRPKKDVVFGPAYLVVEDVPLPLAIPFGFFPFTDSYSSGFIMPSYGDDSERGFYLRDGGYYFAISDRLDLKLTGEIFTKGSWGLGASSTYAKRYRYSGNVSFNYLVTKEGEKGLPDYGVGKNFRLMWNHRQDAKAHPNSNFSASVNYATSNYERSNLTSIYNPMLNSQTVRTSSVSYSKTFPNIGLTISSTMNISQNVQDSIVSLTFPSLNVSLTKKYPFRKKKRAGDERWYEKISLSYTGQMSNSVTSKEDELFEKNLATEWRNGFKHNIPISATFQLFDFINITPSINYTERWYLKKVNQSWDYEAGKVARDTVTGFNRVYNYNMSVSANTTLYGFYQPAGFLKNSRVQMVRHVFKPTVSFTYAPDFGSDRYGYYESYTYMDDNGEIRTVEYSPYEGSLYGVPGKGKTGSITFSVSNNLEMKWRTKSDSLRKVSLIDELGATISYNLAAKTKPWSNLSTRLRLKLSKNYTFSLNAVFATYAYEFNERGQVVVGDRTEWSYGRFGRFQGMSQNISYTFNNDTWKKIKKLFGYGEDESIDADDDDDEKEEKSEEKKSKKSLAASSRGESKNADLDAEGYMPFKMPWSFSVSYGIVMSEDRSKPIDIKDMRYPYKFTQNMNFSGNIGISDNWKINFTSGYNFENKELTTTTLNISRDLHCFEMSCGIVLKPYTSFNFSFRATSQMLADALKWEKRDNGSVLDWY